MKDQYSKNGEIQKELDKLTKENKNFRKNISHYKENKRQLQAELDKLKEENQLLKKTSPKGKHNETKPENKHNETKSETKKAVIKVVIKRFGRIGRNVFRAVRLLYPRKIQIVAIHDKCHIKTNIHLLKYDSATRLFFKPITILDQDRFEIGSGESK